MCVVNFIRLSLIIAGCTCLLTACQGNRSGKLLNGAYSPDLALPKPSGDTLRLSEMRHDKMVLVDFWASWCRPCREAHPFLNEIYAEYKDQKIGAANGFTIYSVSLDDKRESWLKAIEQDRIQWDGLVNDIKGFGAECVETFQFDQIPTSYLLDERGMIVGKNMSAKALEYELKRRQ